MPVETPCFYRLERHCCTELGKFTLPAGDGLVRVYFLACFNRPHTIVRLPTGETERAAVTPKVGPQDTNISILHVGATGHVAVRKPQLRIYPVH